MKKEVKKLLYFRAVHLLWLLPAIFLFAVFIINLGDTNYHNSIVPMEILKQSMRSYESCMVGCGYSLEKFDNTFEPDYLRLARNECNKKCCNLYMTGYMDKC